MARGAAAASATAFKRRVFLNCPFDDAFLPLLHAIAFAVCDCGFDVCTALDDSGSAESRIDKIARFIGNCRLSIHDISRVERDGADGLPRLNMAFECGMAYGARVFGTRGRTAARDVLVLAGGEFSDKRTLSDLGGKDLRYHGGKPAPAIAAVRNFLAAKAAVDGITVRDHADIVARCQRFEAELPAFIAQAKLPITARSLVTFDYLREWTAAAVVWIASTP